MKLIGEHARQRIRELRTQRGVSQQGLADRLHLLGATLDRTAIAKIESGARELSLVEAFQFAQVLDVAPIHLFVPTESKPSDEITLSPNMTVRVDELRAWIRGTYPLNQDGRAYFANVPAEEFYAPGHRGPFEAGLQAASTWLEDVNLGDAAAALQCAMEGDRRWLSMVQYVRRPRS